MTNSTSIFKAKKDFLCLSFLIFSFIFILNFNASQAQDFAALGSGLNGTVYAVTEFNGDLIVGGYFTMAGGTAANRIAKWDGTSWSELGSGMSGPVYALAVYNADLYAGGYFSTAGGVPANNIAKWNGTSWVPLGSGVNAAVYALEVFTNALILGGSFTNAGGVSVNRIARWNGNWDAIGAGPNSSIYTLKVHKNQLYVGGTFTQVGGVSVNRITSWDGNNWFALGSGIGSYVVYALTEYDSNLIVGGRFSTAGGVSANNIASWDGTNWTPLGTGMSGGFGYVRGLTTYLGDLFAGGFFNNAGGTPANRIAKWNGSSWSALGNGMSSYVYSLGVYDATLIIGGYFTMAGTIPANRIAKWGSVPVAPVLISPPNASTQVSLTPTLDWEGVQNAFDYSVQVSDEPNFNTTVVDVTGLSSTEYQVPEGMLDLNTVYFWRTNASNGMGTGPWSVKWFFTTTPVNVSLTGSEIPGEFKLYANYPNPFNPATKIKFDIPEKSFVKLTVYDALGREINTLVNNELSPGSYVADWPAPTGNGAGYTSGVYFYRLEAGNYVETKKMLMIK